MIRRLSILAPCAVVLALAQLPPLGTPEQAPKPKKPPAKEELPPEEDAAVKPKEYTFNPLQAENEMNAGEFYYKKGKYAAAASRFKEATLWNPTLAEAFLRAGRGRRETPRVSGGERSLFEVSGSGAGQ